MKRILILPALLLPVILSGCLLQIKSGASTSTSTPGDGGVFVSLDRGATWEQRVDAGQGATGAVKIGSVNVGFFLFDLQNSEAAYLSTLENGVWKTTDTGRTWSQTTLAQGYIQGLDINQHDSKMFVAGVGNTIQKTTDDAATWTTVYTNQPGNAITQVRFDPFDDQTLYATTSGGVVLKSVDQGTTWKIIFQLPGGDYVKRLTILGNDPRTLLAVTTQSFYRSIDRGMTWTDTIGQGLGQVNARPVNDFTYNIKAPNIMYVAANAGLFRSTDAGATWKTVPTVIPPNTVPILTVALNPFDDTELYFTAGSTFYKSTDVGVTWQTLKNVSTTRQLQVLVAQPRRPGLYYIGTYLPKKK